MPASQAIGTHTVKIGIFSSNWGTLYTWENQAAPLTVQATAPTSFTLAVARAGAGTGSVTSTPAGIACGTD